MSQDSPDQDESVLGRAKSAVDGTVNRTREQLDQARDRIQDVADKVQDVADKVSEKITEAQVNERFSEAQAEARRRAARAKEVAREQYEARSEQFREGYSKVQDNMHHVSDDLGSFVRQNPGRAVLIAAGAGFLLGMLFRGRRE